MQVDTCMTRVEGRVVSFHYVGSEDWTQAGKVVAVTFAHWVIY